MHSRLHYLDGLRGWGALAVVFYHCFVDGFPAGPWAPAHLWRIPLFNGGLAVLLFFAVSGFALSAGYVRTHDRLDLARLAIGRYVRLVVPVAAACAIVFVLLKTGIIPHWDDRPTPFDKMLRFDPSLGDLVSFALWGVFFDYSSEVTFIGPLWTMPIELAGSFIVFGLLAALGNFRHRLILFGIVFAVLFAMRSFYCLFVAGLVIAELQQRSGPRKLWRPGSGLILAGILLAAIGFRTVEIAYYHLAAPIVVLAGVTMFPPAQAFLGNGVSRFLGRISFPLYLIHGPVMLAVSLHLLEALQAEGIGAPTARLVTAGATVPLAILASSVLLPANDAAMRLSRRFGAALIGERVRPA